MKLINKASIIEDGVIAQVESMALRNPHLYEGETVVLMPDVHKTSNDLLTDSVPVGFTMTLSKGLIPVDYISADMYCGVSSYLIEDYIPAERDLRNLSRIARDILSVHRRVDQDDKITDFGTLGGGNHFVEIGTHDGGTLISVHSGSRNYGGSLFAKHKTIATAHTKRRAKDALAYMIQSVPPKERQTYLQSLPPISALPLLDVSLYPQYFDEIDKAKAFASQSREFLLQRVMRGLKLDESHCIIKIESVHNFLDVSGEVPIVRKGSIAANAGDQVVIPINMRDGIILGTVTDTGDVNYSLPHGAGRILSRSKAYQSLDLETFKADMKGIISPTVQQETLDESPRAYKDIETIIKDISPYLKGIRVFKTVFNYKGI